MAAGFRHNPLSLCSCHCQNPSFLLPQLHITVRTLLPPPPTVHVTVRTPHSTALLFMLLSEPLLPPLFILLSEPLIPPPHCSCYCQNPSFHHPAVHVTVRTPPASTVHVTVITAHSTASLFMLLSEPSCPHCSCHCQNPCFSLLHCSCHYQNPSFLIHYSCHYQNPSFLLHCSCHCQNPSFPFPIVHVTKPPFQSIVYHL